MIGFLFFLTVQPISRKTECRVNLLLISVPFEHSVRAVDYSVVVLKVRQPPEVVRIGTKVITRSHLCKGQQPLQLKVADSLLKPPRKNSRRGRTECSNGTEINSKFWAFAVTQNHIRRSTRPFLSLPQHKRKKAVWARDYSDP